MKNRTGIELEFTITDTHVSDQLGNSWSVTKFRGPDKCKILLATLDGCYNCRDCRGCSYCSYCSYCIECSYCRDCDYCIECSYCRYCCDCSGCNKCRYCSKCSDIFASKSFSAPIIANIHKKIFEAVSQPGALDMSQWHTCSTTNCRAGWVVHLAGDLGYELESQTSTLFAAQQIYKASGYQISPNRFYDSNEDAMMDMQRLAEIKETTRMIIETKFLNHEDDDV